MTDDSKNRDSWGDLDWQSYQDIVASLHTEGNENRKVETEYEYTIPGSGSKKIDVYIEDNTGRYTYETLIECKFHEDSVSQDVVDSLNGYLGPSKADKGVIIAKNGFQSGVIERAAQASNSGPSNSSNQISIYCPTKFDTSIFSSTSPSRISKYRTWM